ncbi:pyroglutamylated RF-amide peptide receptor [Syngnathus typhle]|uniref:pyroglutamylated RF-amide peptide receptor n=1 Tax=Syngnathus typhle TaxID=161592 RepID=UPI002A69A9EF|nr:pyroglutamylated RF-amide peptide receptor [Syngnathus typhle]
MSAERWTSLPGPRITPEVLRETLRYYNLTRQEFISTYKIPPLVYVAELPRGAKTAFVLIYALIFGLALSGNSLLLWVVLKKRAARTATDVFVCSLAISDLLITFFCVPFTLLQNITSQWVGGALVCKAVPFVQTTAVVTGILTMTCIAIERYLGIVFPLRMRQQSASERAYKMLGLVWTASLVVGSPMLFVQQLKVKYDFVYERRHVCCQEIWQSRSERQAYTTFIMVALFLFPLAAMLFLYTRIAFELWIRKRVGDSSVLNAMNDRERLKMDRKKKRAVKMMIIIVLLFTVCWAPFHTVHMLFEYHDLENKLDDVTLNMTVAVVQAIGFFNSFNNPIVYAFMNENFKKSCVSALSRCTRRPGRRADVQEPPVHFLKPQRREAFQELHSDDGTKRRLADKGPSASLRGKSSLGLAGEKLSTVQTGLAATSDSPGK